MSAQKPLKFSKIQLRIDLAQQQAFSAVCEEQGISMSDALRNLISKYCADAPVRTQTIGNDLLYKRFRKLQDFRSAENPRISLAEMYCGPGGIALGATKARLKLGNNTFGFQHVWATDYDPDTCQTYAQNILKHSQGSQIICRDVTQLNIDELPKVDGFLYGFPCNDFSSVGESKGMDGVFGPLYKHGVEFINRSNPLFIFAENVSGLSSANSGSAFEKILDDLSNAGRYGYVLTTHLYKFEDYGLPQARHRYIIIGIRKDLGVRFEVPKPSGKKMTCREAIENPPIPKNATNNELTKQAKQVVERLSFIRPGENAWTAELPKHLQLNVKGAQLSQIYKRLDPKRPSYTITGSGGGGTHVYHWAENRALTNRERARLQTFPDGFEFFGSKESVRKQIGMAVPPDGAKIILEAVLKTLVGKSYQTVKPSKGYLN